MKKNRPRSCTGFTLIEVLTVVAIVAIISAIAIPNYIKWSQSAKLRSTVTDLTSDLAMARLRAIKGGWPVKVTFTESGYRVFIDENTGENLLRDKQYPAGITANITFTNKQTTFSNTGRVSSSGKIILSRGGNEQKEIVINFVGRIQVK